MGIGAENYGQFSILMAHGLLTLGEPAVKVLTGRMAYQEERQGSPRSFHRFRPGQLLKKPNRRTQKPRQSRSIVPR
jgi:hypothetical protein